MNESTKGLVVIGGGGFGREILDVADALGDEGPEVLGVVDDDPAVEGLLRNRSVAYLGRIDEVSLVDCSYSIGVGDPSTRKAIAHRADQKGWRAATLIHPSATLGWGVSVGQGSVITAGVRITNNIAIGEHVHLNLNSTVGHDARISHYVTVYPGVNISGSVSLEEGVSLGTGSSVIQGLSIGPYAVVGAGAVVVRSLEGGKTYVGAPAKPI